MTRLTSGIISTALAAAMAVASAIPLNAAPAFVPNGAPTAKSDVLDAQYLTPARERLGAEFEHAASQGRALGAEAAVALALSG